MGNYPFWGLSLISAALVASACTTATKPAADKGQMTNDARYIDFQAPLTDADVAGNLDDQTDRLLHESLQSQIFSIDSEIANKQAQIRHFRMLDDQIWNSQMSVLEAEITQLQAEKSRLEAEMVNVTP